MTQEELWSYLGREIVNSDLGHDKIKFLGFLSCTRYCGEKYRPNFTHDEIVKITQAYVALGGGGLALFGSACLHTWPENISQVIPNFINQKPIDRAKFMDDSCYRGTLGACFSTTLGSVLHELCHTFDLGHTEKGIMGRGFDDIYKVFVCNKRSTEMKKFDEDGTFWTRSCLVLLAYHKWLNNHPNDGKGLLKFDPVHKILSSTKGLRVIELRNEGNGMVLFNWVFEGRILKYSFQIPNDQLVTENYVMIVEDNVGNILKHEIKLIV
ncbi:hypothetical protein TcasGA2_TC001918 [Tribolium castaneum]|uniref:Uncharacterized protein n=1 Tax=Tribolium castaneum TaxID=7070 RepID=D6X172_TRICA|nr:hypothetical protein TcasGA2_TC001918 [Tribolium castaneum]